MTGFTSQTPELSDCIITCRQTLYSPKNPQYIFLMNTRLKGTLCGIAAAVSYGTNPLGALYLYRDGLNPPSVLFYRFTLAAILLAGLMIIQKKNFSLTRKETALLALLGLLFAASSMTYYISFRYMDAGIASTLLFVYPVMVAVIMAVCFKEKLSATAALAIALALGGIGLLYQGNGETALSTIGVLMVMISSLTYALYIIIVNRSPLMMSSIKLTFYVLVFCAATITLFSFTSPEYHLQVLPTFRDWILALGLALVPTVLSLVLMVMAVHVIGSTPTAVMGALEPLTAVLIGVTIFGEAFTIRLGTGICLILCAVVLIILGKTSPATQLFYILTRLGQLVRKHWRWK